eukprot:363500-Chlamydomonas_euryale.AAC.20
MATYLLRLRPRRGPKLDRDTPTTCIRQLGSCEGHRGRDSGSTIPSAYSCTYERPPRLYVYLYYLVY